MVSGISEPHVVGLQLLFESGNESASFNIITTQENGISGPVGVSVQRTGPSTWSTSVGANTFGPTYQNYFTTQNTAGVATCRLLPDGSIVYTAGGGSGCSPSQMGAFSSPVTQPPLNAAGPRLLGPGVLPDATTRAALIAASGKSFNPLFRELQPPPNQPPPSSSPPPPFQAVPPPPHAPCDPNYVESCSGTGNGSIAFSILTSGQNMDSMDGGSITSAMTPIAIRSLDFGHTPPALFTSAVAAASSYIACAALFLTQTPADGSGSALFFAPDSGMLSFLVSGPAPSGSVYMIAGAQTMGCSASDAWQAAAGATAPGCAWRVTLAGLYARYDAITSTAATSALHPENWGGLYGLYLFKKAEIVVPSSTVTVDPANVSSIQGEAGSMEMGGVFGYEASVSGTEGITAFAAYFPGEIQPVDPTDSGSGGSGSRRRLLTDITPTEATVTAPVASGLLFLKQGNRTFAPNNGTLMFGGVSDAGVDSFFLSAFRYSNCTPQQLNKVTGFDGCVWTQVPHNITLAYNATAQTMALGNLGKGTWNSVYMLLSVSSLPPPPAPPVIEQSPPPSAETAGSNGYLAPLVGAVAGLFVLSGLVMMVACGKRKKRQE
ncbi:hypothetical protein KFL_008970040 [Klebsormidium nitens]|uniref:Uncharacterized protein n=1 Tax=Klebsormidium nitens TaxID=105231 RepID=A0A1Y1IMG1_KLENI|nr:hypothetical protein KFL_008970040 [Klebsormidium nitens]|eukprot:GAQ91984.1 hypothetical protein KFL_008970040 [Klebsormidium nitens]